LFGQKKPGTCTGFWQQKLAELVQAAEYIIVLRLRELENSTGHRKVRIQLKRAASDSLAINTHKLEWPSVAAG
jgi:hypothetical protein